MHAWTLLPAPRPGCTTMTKTTMMFLLGLEVTFIYATAGPVHAADGKMCFIFLLCRKHHSSLSHRSTGVGGVREGVSADEQRADSSHDTFTFILSAFPKTS